MASEHVVLTTMTRNESENVLSMLRSVEGLYSAVVWGFDDNTTDNTKELVLGYFADQDIPQVFYDFTWQNDFSYARNLYLDLALEKFPEKPWLLIMDGDDLLSPGNPPQVPDGREVITRLTDLPTEQFPYKAVNFYVYLDPDAYGIPTLFYPRVHLVRNLPDVRFQFASHNAITVAGDEQILVRECIIVHKQQPKKRAEREVQRVEMNIPNLEQQGEQRDDHGRGLFYLGNTLMDAGRGDEAEQAYVKYLEVSTWHDERYQARIHLAGLYLMRGDFQQAAAQAKQALLEPNQYGRAEAYIVLSDCALSTGDTIEAIHWLTTSTQCRPQVNGLFLQGHLYTWFPHWRLALLFDRLGFYRDALAHATMAYQWRKSPEIEGVMGILAQYTSDLKARGEAVANYTEAEPFVPIYAMSEAAIAGRLGL